MEETVKQRLIKYLKYKGIGQTKFEEVAGLSRGYITNIKKEPSTTKLLMILSAAPDLNKDWLMTGEGEMLLPQEGGAPVVNDNHTSVAGNANQVNATSTLDKALDEIAAQRRLTEKAHEQIDRLISLLEKQQK